METTTFKIIDSYAEGSYSIVYRAKQIPAGNLVAVKRCREINKREKPIKERVERELKILCILEHENVISVIPNKEPIIILDAPSNIEINVNSLVFPFCPYTLGYLLKNYKLNSLQQKSCIWMILSGIAYIHEHGIIHRDLSSKNVLITKDGIIKISDLGNAWVESICDDEVVGEMKHDIGTRCYRAPELLLSCHNYDYSVDLWSTGCIIAEFFTKPIGSILFNGESDIEQLIKIFRVFGVPTLKNWPEMKDFHDYGKVNFIHQSVEGLTNKQLPNANSKETIEFIKKYLKYPKKERLTANKVR
nr:6171_t:CDS:2 [Entrophospora candida]CAG8626689.1 9661_t:CDS:2 [Entrophospora candida]